MGELNEKEMASRAEIETKLNLIQQGEVVEKISVLNERQKKLDLLDLPQEASDENETQTEKNFFDRLSQQILTLLAVGGLILIFLWRWYRKKREEDPF